MFELQDGCLRLVVARQPSLQLWNTPAPPSLRLCTAYPADDARCQTLHAVEMDEIQGLTFFFSDGSLFGLHVHQRGDSCAMDSYSRAFSNRRRRSIVWIYLPISQPDRALLLGVREQVQPRVQSIVIRTKLVGDVIVGLQCRSAVRDASLGASAPLTMIYGEPKPGNPVCFFGAYCRLPALPAQVLTKGFCLPNPSGSPLSNEAYFSWAPLSSVSSTLVFYDESNGACRGVLLRYENGGARAVGQCRLQVDPTEEVDQPVRLCLQIGSHSSRFDRILYTAHVKFKQDPQAGGTLEDEGWKSYKMQGIMKFWFTPESCFAIVEN